MNYSIEPISKEAMLKLWKTFVEIDKAHVASGMLENWDKEHYLFEIKDKWRLSYYLYNNQHQIIGYKIVSGRGKFDNYCHTHRTSIKYEFCNLGYGSILQEKCFNSAKEI